MATAAAEFTIPAPYASSFTNGEKGVGQPSAGAGEHRFARRFKQERTGLYMIKVWCTAAGSVRIGTSSGTLVKQFDVPANKAIITQVVMPAGEHRMDVWVSNPSAGATVGFATLIYHPDRVLYASDNEGWAYEVGATVADGDVPALAESDLPVFSILPNWASGITERVQYLTDIPTSETGTEQRRSIRRRPRREFDASFMRADAHRARLDAFMLGIGVRKFWLPLWHEQYRPAAGVTGSTVQFPTGTLQLREFRVGDKVLATAGDPDKFEVLTVQSLNYTTDVLTWVNVPLQPWPAGSRIIPLRRARITDQSSLSTVSAQVGTTGLRFTLADPDVRFGASWNSFTPVWNFKINRAEALSFQFNRMTYTTDNSVGPVEIVDPGDDPMVTMRSAVLLRGRQELVAMRRFIDIAEGRAGRFYMPTGMRDIEPATDTFGGLTLDAKPGGYSDYLTRLMWPRTIIAVRTKDGMGPHYRFITKVERVGSVERFTFDNPLPTVQANEVSRIEFMVPSRFDQDAFELHHKVDDGAAVTMSVVTRSVDGTDMPPPAFSVTSRPYRMVELPEAVDVGLNIVSGTLRMLFKTYNPDAEGVTPGINIVGGTLT